MSFSQPLALLLLVLPVAAVLTWLRFPPPLSRPRARLSLGLRVVILTLVVLALAGLGLQSTPRSQALLVLVDRSASVTAAADQVRDLVQRLAAGRRADDEVGTITFGRDALVDTPPGASA